ncbi:ABC transporter substrate-binding protein [Paenibacillus bouchesdurhonensis]|uniref:ABC transporter substrate-binding protein n=1 Tax=Paenibacillus bouchesdurhonensis TaxID=1870990 RepID=UPI000DA63A58|nr:ABC transporter substrate-binding protein [Paenibacillus bouchesdurhonensis]
MKRGTKSSISLLIAIVIILSTMVACSGNANTKDAASTPGAANSTDTDKKNPVKITALIQQSRNFEGLQKMIKKLETDENIIIDAQVVPDAESLNLIKMKLNSGESVDMIDYNIPAVYDMIDPVANFADLSNESWISKLIMPDNIKHEDGKIYGFPFQSVPGIHGMIYNKDVFEQLEIAVPTTWDELLAASEKIKTEGDGITPIFIPKDSWVPQILMTDNFAKALGVEKTAEFAEKVAKNEMKWTDVPEFQTVIDKYLELYQKGYVNTNFTSAVYDDAIAAVANGKAAMHFNGDFFAASVMDANPEANIGIFQISMTPGIDVVTANTSSAGFVAYKNSKNLDTVKRVFELWSTPEYADLYFEGRPAFPAFKDVNGGEVPSYLAEIDEKYIQQGKAISEFNAYVMQYNPLFENSLYIYYVSAPATNDLDGKGVMEKFQKEFEQYNKDIGTPGF